jgi:uncharacterized protein HemX
MTTPEPPQPNPSYGYQGPGYQGPEYQGPPQPPNQPAAPRPKRTAVVVLTIVVVLLLAGAGTFAALWITERSNHDKTTEQLSTRDKDLANEKKSHDDTKSKLSDAEKAKTDADAKVKALTPCAEAGKALTKLALNPNSTEQQGIEAGQAVVLACGS